MKKKEQFILIVGFIISFLFSCDVEYTPRYIDIDFDTISVIGTDNSGEDFNRDENNTMYASAVALNLSIFDSSETEDNEYTYKKITKIFSFNSAYALSPKPPIYLPINEVVAIDIKTVFKINDDIEAGDDVTQYFLCDEFYGGSNLYMNLDEGIKYLNTQIDNYEDYYPQSKIYLVLKPTIENTNAQFNITVTLDNGTELTTTTELFTIIES